MYAGSWSASWQRSTGDRLVDRTSRDGGFVVELAHADRGDAVLGTAQDFEAVAMERERLTGLGDRLCLVDDEARDRHGFRVWQVPVHFTVDVADGDAAVDIDGAVGLAADRCLADVVLVDDLADDFLEDVLERDQALDLAIFVNDEGELRLAREERIELV